MWLNDAQLTETAIKAYRKTLRHNKPHHVVIDNLFCAQTLQAVLAELKQEQHWQTQQHTYAALYVDDANWQQTPAAERFVKRDCWRRPQNTNPANIAEQFLGFVRSQAFLALLSRLFALPITDRHVANPSINSNFFRLSATDFIKQHADDSPGRAVCMLLYFNENWADEHGGELMFAGQQQPISISPKFNRCVLFDPASEGAEHWVNALKTDISSRYRYNLTSWYWTL